jgi:phage terminase small subunit
MAGRPPKPTALKLLQGNPGRRPLNTQEPKPPPGAEMPEALLGDPVAVKNWKTYAPKLTALGILTEVDARAFGRLCRLWAEEDGRTKMLDPETGLRLPSDPRLLAEIRQLEERFGMNPSSRVKLKVEKPKPQSKLEGLMSGAKRS